jgi:hypothetical protein
MIQGLVTPPLIQHTGYGTFIFFGIFSVLSGVWTWFFVAETKCVSSFLVVMFSLIE